MAFAVMSRLRFHNWIQERCWDKHIWLPPKVCAATSAQSRTRIPSDQPNWDIWGHCSKWIRHPEDPANSKERSCLPGARVPMPARMARTLQLSACVGHSSLGLQAWHAVIDGIIVKRQKIVVPQKTQKLHQVHQGVDKSIQRARDKWFWPGMSEQIKRPILTCPSCLDHQPRQKQAAVSPVISTKKNMLRLGKIPSLVSFGPILNKIQ